MNINDMPFSGDHDHRPEQIIRAAVDTIGEDLSFVLWRLSRLTREKRIDLACPSATSWFYLCRLLYLDMDCFSYGYVKRIHLVQCWRALMAGMYRWRKTTSLDAAVTALTRFEDDNWRFQLDHTGDPLHSRIKKQWAEVKSTGYIGRSQARSFEKANRLFRDFHVSSSKTIRRRGDVFHFSRRPAFSSGPTSILSNRVHGTASIKAHLSSGRAQP